MSPSETSNQEGLLEHPGEAFTYYRRTGVSWVVVEEKHMRSRAVVVICRDAGAAATRFRVPETQRGVIYTRTGRPFFSDPSTEHSLLDRHGNAMTACEFWDRFDTSWACLDAELMPWSAKAQSLIDEQYSPVGTAAIAGLNAAVEMFAAARARGIEIGDIQDRFEARRDVAIRYDSAWRQYAWDVAGIDDLKLAPFHLLATEGAVHADQDHAWHMRKLAEICAHDSGVLLATSSREVALDDAAAITDAISWWGNLTRGGGEGIVMKPGSFIARGSKGLIQPALKVRGAEYLRIIYGPEYTLPGKLERLRQRGLSGTRRLALQEFALGLEALQRFVSGEHYAASMSACSGFSPSKVNRSTRDYERVSDTN